MALELHHEFGTFNLLVMETACEICVAVTGSSCLVRFAMLVYRTVAGSEDQLSPGELRDRIAKSLYY